MVKFSHRHIHFYLKHLILLYKSSRLQMFFKIGILKNSQENTCLRVSFYSCRPQGKNIFKQNLFASSPVILSKEILAQVFSYEHRKISKNDNFFYRTPLVACSAYKIENGGANYQHEFAKHWASCCLCWKIIIQFQKCLIKANHDSPSDSHFKYILDLTDKSLSNLARNVSVLRCLLTVICWTVVQIFFMILHQCLTERVFDFWYEVFHSILTIFPKNFSKFRFLWNYFIIFSMVNCLVFDWFFSVKLGFIVF